MSPLLRDPNPIIDTGCPKSVGGIESAIALSNAMGIEFSISPLDCAPFLHGYGMECSESKVTIGIWYLPITDLNGTRIKLPFYLVQGDGVLLLGHSITSRSNIMNEEKLLVIPARTAKLSEHRIVLPIYSSGERNYLFVVPSQTSAFSSYFTSARSLFSTKLQFDKAKFSDGKFCKWFASKLHAFTHYPLTDMISICADGKVLTPNLRQALKVAADKCISCKTTGRPKNQRKVSFDKLIKGVNEHVQVDYFFITEISERPILHARDKASGFSATRFVTSRDMEIAVTHFRRMWIDVHGPPRTVSGDPEFNNSRFKRALTEEGIKFEARPARRHNKIGVVEARHNSLRLICLRLFKDAEHYRAARGITIPPADLLSKATFLANALRGNSKLSSFELARGYQPAFIGLPQTGVSKELFDAYREQTSIRTICKLLESRSPKLIKPSLLPRKTQVFYFVKEPAKNRGKWKHGYVFRAEDHLVQVTSNARGAGAKSLIAYEDIRLVPSSPLLLELAKLDLEFKGHLPVSIRPEGAIGPNPEELTTHPSEAALWSCHPFSRTYLAATPDETEFNESNFDIGAETPIEETQKDIGDSQLPLPTHLPVELQSCEQTILQRIKSIYGYDAVTKSKLQFVPSWVLEKAEEKEKSNYKESIEVVDRRDVPRSANIISSHFFFKLKEGDEPGQLALKCRCVPHGNRDKVKEELRSDSSTAQFPVIRSLLSLAAYHKYAVAKVDISGAFLQGGTLERDIYVRPPTSWMTSRSELWKLVRPAYGLVESGRTWQLACEKWMRESYKLTEVPGFAQMFVLHKKNKAPAIFIAKVVDDFLLAGTPQEIDKFHTAISKRFKVGTFCPKAPFTFNALLIEQTFPGIDASLPARKPHQMSSLVICPWQGHLTILATVCCQLPPSPLAICSNASETSW